MLCREYQEFFSDLYDGDLASERRADLESHLASCSPCQDEYKIFKESLAALQGMGEVPASDKFAARVRYAISQDKERGMLYAETGLAKPSTRRVMAPPPARRTWAFGLAGVAAVAAMALGVLYVSQRDELQSRNNDLAAKKREVASLEEKLRNVPKPEVLDNVVLVNGKKIAIDDFIRQKMADQGLVATGTTWISKEIKEHLDKGEVKVEGTWTPMAQVVQQGIEDWRKKNPEVTKQGLTEDEVLASKGLVPHGKWFVPKEWAAALEQGQLITKSGESQDPREIIAAAMKENNLVDYEGRWMTDEQRTELMAQRRVQKSDLITTDSAVTRALDNLEIGAPLGYKNLTLYPLLSKKQKDVAFTTLPEAITTEKIELTDDINALQIHVKNKGTSELVVLAGEILAGGNYGRVVAKDTIIPAQSTAVVDVFDAEPTVCRAMAAPKFAKESGHYWAPLGVRRALVSEQGQGAVWSLLQTMMAGKVSTPEALYAMHRSALFEYRAALYDFHNLEGIVGVAVAVGDNVVASELFANHAMFVNQFDRVLNSASIEAILASQSVRMPSSLPSSAASVKRMLENVFSAEHEKSEGSIVLKRNGVPFGNAVLKGDDALRVTIFADGALEARNAADVPAAKFTAILAAFNDRLKASTPARRQALYREMAMLPARIAKPLGEHLKNSRKEAATFEAVAQTLSKLGGEDSAMALIRELDPDTLECAKIAAEYIPAAMRTLKERVPLEKAVTALISNMEHITSKAPAEELQKTADANGFPFTVQTLRLAMRLDGQKVADYSAWWKDPVHRDEFYARMLK